jgi:hypothetical protein
MCKNNNLTLNKKAIFSNNENSSATNLDTLDASWLNAKISLTKSAYYKHLTNEKIKLLVDATDDDKWKKRYWNTWHCKNILLRSGGKISGKLCRNKWCRNCNRIKTAEMTNGYKQPIQDLGELHFITLTAPTCFKHELKAEIHKRIKVFTQCKNNLRKNHNMKINGLRKLEVTATKGKFHPHFHIILSGKNESEALVKEWLKRFPKASGKAQNIKNVTANENSFIELFKYATKDITTDKATAYQEHTIYEAMFGVRSIQTFGTIRKLKAPIEAKIEQVILGNEGNTEDNEIFAFSQIKIEWQSSRNEELIGDIRHVIIEHIKSNKNNKNKKNYVKQKT